MKISFCIIVVDGMPFIKHQLKLIYPHAHQIIICEGGDLTWEKVIGSRRSQDGTIETIETFPDPENKIQLIQKNWADKNQMCHEYSKHATGDIIWHVDVDEFIDPVHFPYIVSIFDTYPEYDAMAIPQVIFFGDTRTVMIYPLFDIRGCSWKWTGSVRIFRYKKGQYIHHLPKGGYHDPATGEFTPVVFFPDHLFLDKEIYNFHFSNVLPESVLAKMKYHEERSPNLITPNWFENIFLKFEENREEWIESQFNISKTEPNVSYGIPYAITPLEIPFPGFLKDLEREIMNEVDQYKANGLHHQRRVRHG